MEKNSVNQQNQSTDIKRLADNIFNSEQCKESEGAKWISKYLNQIGIKSSPWFAQPGFRSWTTPISKRKNQAAWEKMKTNPLISKLDSNAGTGHGDLFYDKRGRMKYVLHTHLSNEEVGPRKTAILELSLKNQKLSVKNNSFYFVEKQ